MENNAKCHKCNKDFSLGAGASEVKCPHCGSTIDALRARKYFITFQDQAEKREMHGQNYFRYEEYLHIGAHHLEKDEFDKAAQAYKSATELNPSDYRGYMGLVAVETRNYTDIKNTTHKQYLQRAIAVADEAEQKKIAQNYKIYSMKISMSDDEYLEYLAEKQKDYKARIKKAIIGLSSVNQESKKKAKIAFIAMWSLVGLGAIMCVLGFVFTIYFLMVPGFLVMFGSTGLSIIWQRQRFNESLYDFLVALFNGLVSFSLTSEQTDKVLSFMAGILLAVKNGDPSSTMDAKIEGFVEYGISIKNKQMDVFLQSQKISSKYLKQN